MATKSKRKEPNDGPYKKLQADLKAGTAGGVYLFYGEEDYLRQHSLEALRKLLVPAGSEEFNYHVLEGKGLPMQDLAEMAEAMPMLAEHTLLVVNDCDLYKLPEDQRTRLQDLLEDFPPYCCLVFVYDAIPYKPNRTLRRFHAALEAHVQAVEFQASGTGPLVRWIQKHFRALGKEIAVSECEYLIFTCGSLMAGLAPEIEKVGAYAKGERITREDIDAVAVPVLSAETFRMTDAVIQGDANRAASILGDLLALKTRPAGILVSLGTQLRQLWTARIALDTGRGQDWLAKLWGMHPYRAKLLLQAARRTDRRWCAESVRRCQVLDRRMKSERGVDDAAELKLLLVRLEAERR